MKEKNLPVDIKSKSLDELKEILNNLVEKIEKNKASYQSEEEYLALFKLNRFNRLFDTKFRFCKIKFR